jgi:hypothetical protein
VRVVVGCPVYEREWVLSAWFDALDDWRDHVDLHFRFVYTPGSDRTETILRNRAENYLIFPYEDGDHSTERNWGKRSRLETLAYMRNFLITQVRLDEPDWYLSLDSDILVSPWSESQALFDTLFDAVAPLVYLGPGDVSNAFMYQKDHHRRIPDGRRYGVDQKVDVIAAAKLMKPKAYNGSFYGYDKYGEDFYWARQMREQGITLALNSSVKWKHVMDRDSLYRVDQRLGW